MDKRERLLCAALNLFNVFGFYNTPTARISKEANVATGTLFNYFESKEELINVLYLRCKDSLVEHLMINLSDETTYRGKLKRIYMNYLDWSIKFSGEFLFFQQFSNSPHIVAKTREEGVLKVNGLLDLIREGLALELIKDVQLEYLGVLVSGIFNANANYCMNRPELIEDSEFIATSFSFMWDSIRR